MGNGPLQNSVGTRSLSESVEDWAASNSSAPSRCPTGSSTGRFGHPEHAPQPKSVHTSRRICRPPGTFVTRSRAGDRSQRALWNWWRRSRCRRPQTPRGLGAASSNCGACVQDRESKARRGPHPFPYASLRLACSRMRNRSRSKWRSRDGDLNNVRGGRSEDHDFGPLGK